MHGIIDGIGGVRTALSPNAGLKHQVTESMLNAYVRQNSAKPERGIETAIQHEKRYLQPGSEQR